MYNISTETGSRKEEGKTTQKKNNKSEMEINGELTLVKSMSIQYQWPDRCIPGKVKYSFAFCSINVNGNPKVSK